MLQRMINQLCDRRPCCGARTCWDGERYKSYPPGQPELSTAKPSAMTSIGDEMTTETRATSKQLKTVNGRLKTGEGWIGYRNGGASGLFRVSVLRLLPPGAPQKFVNSKTNDVEDAYRQLLAARARQIVASWSCRPKRHASPTNSSPTNTLRTGGSLKHRSLGTSTSFSPR